MIQKHFYVILLFLASTSCQQEQSITFSIQNKNTSVIGIQDLECINQFENILQFKLNESAAKNFAEYTKHNIGSSLSISLCQNQSSPIIIQETISSGLISYTLKNDSEHQCAKQLEKKVGVCRL